MVFFMIAVTINCIAILLAIANAIYDAFNLEHSYGHNNMANLSGFVLAGIVLFSFYLRSREHIALSNILVWIPAVPLLLTGLFLLLIIILKPDWK